MNERAWTKRNEWKGSNSTLMTKTEETREVEERLYTHQLPGAHVLNLASVLGPFSSEWSITLHY
jgi:hypothetical protein